MEPEPREFSGGGRFSILRRIGAGGMGVVYEAIDNERQVRVALKTLPRAEPEALLRFKQEFRNLADVAHPNLAALYELFSVGEKWFFSMELVDGVDFLTAIRPENEAASSLLGNLELTDTPTVDSLPGETSGAPGSKPVAAPLSQEQIDLLRRALAQLAAGLSALHDAGKMHRDIKPSNVLVTPEGRVVVLDFGLTSGLRDPQERDGHFTGTIAYTAPEQAAGQPLTAACDWYSVGVMLYQTLTGRLPHTGTWQEILSAKQSRDPAPPSSLVPETPSDLEDLCLALLSRDPKSRPSGRDVGRRLSPAGGPAAPLPAEPAEALFVGREKPLHRLRSAFERVQAGHPVTLFVHGRSGAGKSSLVARFLETLETEAVILTGRCYETEWVPYKGLDSLVDALARYLSGLPKIEAVRILPRDARALVRVFPVLRQVEALEDSREREAAIPNQQEMRRRAFRALKDLLARLGDSRPLVLAIDDLQWGDLDSAALLSDLLQPPDPPILLLLGIYRSEYAESSPGLARLLENPDGTGDEATRARETLEIEPLTEQEARTLAAALLGTAARKDEALPGAIARESGGVPFFVHELVEYVREGARLAVADGSAQPISLDEVLRRRLEGLPETTRRLLEVIALSGRPLRQADVSRAAALESADLTALSLLHKSHFVRSTGPGEKDTVETYHDRIAQAVLSQISPGARLAHHRSLARTLESAGGYDPETLAIHFGGAGENEKAGVYYAQAAGGAAETLAFDRAAKLYRLSLEMRPAEGQERRRLQRGLADALANAGRGAQAARVYEQAQVSASEEEALDLQRRAAYQYCVSGHIDEGRAALRNLLGRFGTKLPESRGAVLLSLLAHRARLRLRGLKFRERRAAEVPASQLRRIDVTWSAATGLSMIDIIAGAAFQARGFLLALNAGEPSRIARSLAWEAAHCSNDGSPGWNRTRRLVAAAGDLARRVGDPHAMGIATMSAGIAEFTMGRWASAVPFLEASESLLRERCTGVAWELDTAHTFSLWALLYQGEFAQMSARTALLLREAEELGDLYVRTNIDTYMQPYALLALDDPEGARATVAAALERWSQEGFHLQHFTALLSETAIDLYQGRGEDAWQRMSRTWAAVLRSQMMRIQVIRILMHHFRARSALQAALGARDPRPLIARAASDARRIAREGVEWSRPTAQGLQAGIAILSGRPTEAAALFGRAADGYDSAGMGSYAAAARRRMGEILGGEQGQRLVEESDRWHAEHGVRDSRNMARAHVAEIKA